MASLISTLIESNKSLLDDKPNSKFEAYRKIRKPTPPPTKLMRDKKRYDRSKRNNYESDDI